MKREQQEDMLSHYSHQKKYLPHILILPIIFIVLACQKNEFVVEMHYADTTSGRQLPYGAVQRFDLTPLDSTGLRFHIPEPLQKTALITELNMGNSGKPMHLLLAKTDTQSIYFDRLLIDRNKDFDFTNDNAIYTGKGQFINNRNRHYTEFDPVALPYEWQNESKLTEEPFLCKLYFWYPEENGLPKTCSIMRLGWREGVFTFGGKEAQVVLVDDDGNGLFDTSDRWALFPKDSLGDKFVASLHFFRDVTRYGWLGETAFELSGIAPQGNNLRLRIKQVELTSAEDIFSSTPYSHEARRPRAARQISWLTDYNAALRKARREKKNILVNFCTSWSGPCLILEERTFNDAEVVTLTDEYICLKLDGDLERKLVKQFDIQNYPTLLVLDARGKERSKVIGYQPAAEFSAYLKQYIKKKK
jgi:thiol-disulfide isomerase/thioredoxin